MGKEDSDNTKEELDRWAKLNKEKFENNSSFLIIEKDKVDSYRKRTLIYMIGAVIVTIIFIGVFYFLGVNDKFSSNLLCPQNVSNNCEEVILHNNVTFPTIICEEANVVCDCPSFPTNINVDCGGSP